MCVCVCVCVCAVAELKAEAARIETEVELESQTRAREAEIQFLKEQSSLEISKARQLGEIEVCSRHICYKAAWIYIHHDF